MDDDMNKDKTSCFNCKYFLQYYIKEKWLFEPIDYGHCKRRVLTCKESIGFPFACGCNFWEEKPQENE